MQVYTEMVNSDVTWIGEMPANWQVKKFSSLYTATNAGEVIPKEYWDVDGPLLMYTASQSPMRSMFPSFPSSKRTKLDDILIARNGDGVIHQPEENSIYTNVVQRVSFARSDVCIRYVIYALKASLDYVHGQSNGDFIVSLNMGMWNNTRLPVPQRETQQKIADFLDTETAQIDNLIAKQERLLELLEEKRRATITHAVTRGLDPNVELKETDIPWLGQIPAHWNVNPLFKYVKENKRSNKGMLNENVLTLSYGKIKEKNLDNGGLMPESFETYQIVKPGDIILRLTDLQNDKTSLRVGHSSFEGIITSAYVDISSVSYKSKYLYYLLHAYDLMKVFYNLGAGLRQGMNFSDLKRLPAFGVEQDEQQQIIDYLESYERKTDELKQKIQTQITLLRERRTSLISHAVTGKVMV